MSKVKTIKIDDVEYVRADSLPVNADTRDGMEYVLIRTYSAGVFAGYLVERSGKEARLVGARRLWKWAGASCLSQIATEGVRDPGNCKFSCETDVTLTEVIEIIPITKPAQASIASVEVWK